MPSLAERWTSLSTPRRAMLIAAAVLALGLGIMAAMMSGGKPKALLFGNLDARSMGEVVLRLDELGASYEMQDTTITVDANVRDGLRLALAARGLPMPERGSYAMLDTGDLSRPAIERELARTLLSLPDIAQARVGLRPRGGGGITASIGLVSVSGAPVPAASALTARQFVALAAPNLSPMAIPVFDGPRQIALPMDSPNASQSLPISSDRAEILKGEIEDLLHSLVGKNSLRVSVAVETNREASAREHRFLDPESRVLRRTESTEIAQTRERTGEEEDETGSSEGVDENRSSDRYDYSETLETSTRNAGAVSRITVAVLIDLTRETAADGTVTETPRPARDIAKIDALVKSAIGYDETRGDSVTVEQLSFAEQAGDAAPGTIGALPSLASPLDVLRLIQIGVVALVVLVLGLFVVRPVLLANAATPPAPALTAGGDDAEEEDDFFGDMGFTTAGMGDLPDFGNASAEMSGLDDLGGSSGPDPRDRLLAAITNQMDDSADVLRDWLEDEKEPVRRRAG